MIKGKFVRLKWSTWKRLKRVFSSVRGESAAHYFERLAEYLEKEARMVYVDEDLK